jgi:hypothetical protein
MYMDYPLCANCETNRASGKYGAVCLACWEKEHRGGQVMGFLVVVAVILVPIVAGAVFLALR